MKGPLCGEIVIYVLLEEMFALVTLVCIVSKEDYGAHVEC